MPEPVLRRGAKGEAVKRLQKLLDRRGYSVEVDGVFGPKTLSAVKAFQSQNVDACGDPLVVDGVVGALSWRSLQRPRPVAPVNYERMPPGNVGGSTRGRKALRAAIGELKDGAREIGANRGKWVRKYLDGMADEPANWCAGFVSWCFSRNSGEMPFRYTLGAQRIRNQMRDKGWTHEPRSGYVPLPGDVVVWWRGRARGWQGHVGLVHQCRDGYLYTIEGNKNDRVKGCRYVLSRMEKLLGFGHVPDEQA